MHDELRSLGSVRTRGILLLLAVAVAGGVAGGVINREWFMVERAWTSYRGDTVAVPGVSVEPRGERRRGPGRGEREPRLSLGNQDDGVPYSLRAVDLTADQRKQIIQITAKFRPAAESLMRSVRDRVLALDLHMRQEAMCVLTPKQREDWVVWRKREHLSLEEGDVMMQVVTSNSCAAEGGAKR